MKQLLLWLIVTMVLLIALLLYRSRSANNLNVTPEAQREIEKAKQQ